MRIKSKPMVGTELEPATIALDPKRRNYNVRVVNNDYVKSRWNEIEEILYRVFSGSQFNSDFKRTRPAEHTWLKMHEDSPENAGHVMAFDQNNEILGAFFVIPTFMPEGQEECDIGWMFTIELHRRFRHEVLDSIVNMVHDTIRDAGFKRIVTEMGTDAGARFLAKKYGYIHKPTETQDNRWIKELEN